MKINNNIYPDNFSIEFTENGTVLRYSLKLDKNTASKILKDNQIIRTPKGTYVFYREFTYSASNEEVRKIYYRLKRQTMIKCRELKRKALLQEIRYIQTSINF